MTRKRKLFLGTTPIGGPTLKSRRIARRVTSQYHNIRQSVATVEQRSDLSAEQKRTELAKLHQELKEMGGVNRYQEASVISTQHFQTSKWIIQTLRRLNRLAETGSKEPINTLEVGAINDQLASNPILKVRAIDVNARLPCIEQLDFFDLLPAQTYDLVVCSMVINCVFDPSKRAEMIGRLCMQLTAKGVLVLILPKRCLDNSNMQGASQFANLLTVTGLRLIEEPHFTPRLAFFVVERDAHRFDQALHSLSVAQQKSLGSSVDSNRVEDSAWSTIVQTMMMHSRDEETKAYFSNDCLNTDEFCLRIPHHWLSNTITSSVENPKKRKKVNPKGKGT